MPVPLVPRGSFRLIERLTFIVVTLAAAPTTVYQLLFVLLLNRRLVYV